MKVDRNTRKLVFRLFNRMGVLASISDEHTARNLLTEYWTKQARPEMLAFSSHLEPIDRTAYNQMIAVIRNLFGNYLRRLHAPIQSGKRDVLRKTKMEREGV